MLDHMLLDGFSQLESAFSLDGAGTMMRSKS